MPLKKHIIWTVVMLLTTVFSFAQTEDEVRVKADALFKNKEYVEATPLYLRLLSLQPKSYEYSYKYGTCLLFNSNSKQDAIRYLTYAVKSPTTINEAYFFLGKAYHLNYQFNDAIREYKNYLARNPKGEFANESHRNSAMCENGKNLLTTLTDVIVRKKTEIKQEDFFRLYDLSEIGGSIIFAVDFQTKNDKKYNHKPVVHLAPNMENVYFSSYGDGDNLDIYVARRLPGGKFGVPQKINGGVNTPFDEDFPYMHPNGNELYFSSKGHNSMGGYDIFRAKFDTDNNAFSEVANVDFSISSPDDDILYVVDKESKNAYFSSKRQSQDGKIVVYKVAVERIPIQLAIVKGGFQSSIVPGNPKMTVDVVDKTNGRKIGTFNTLKENSYLITFPKGGKYEYRVKIEGVSQVFTAEVEIPFLKELRPLKQRMFHEMAGEKEQIRIANLFNEEVEDAQSIVSQVLKERANLNVNEDQFDSKELEDELKTRAVIAELRLGNRSVMEVGQVLESKIEELKSLASGQNQVENKANGINVALYNEIAAIDVEIKELVKEADASESNRRKEMVLNNAKELYQTREEKQQRIQQIQKEANEMSVSGTSSNLQNPDKLEQISKQYNQLLNEGKATELRTLLEENKDYLTKVLNDKQSTGTDELLKKQSASDGEIKRLQSLEQVYQDEIKRFQSEVATLQTQKEAAKDKLKQDFQYKIDDKTLQITENETALAKTRALIQKEAENRNEVTKKLNLVNEIETFQGKTATKTELASAKESINEDKSRTLKTYVESSLKELAENSTSNVASTATKTIEQYNAISEEIYANEEWNDYQKQSRLLSLNAEKQKELSTSIQEIESNSELNETEKTQQKSEVQKSLQRLKEDQTTLKSQFENTTKKEIENLKTENIIAAIYPDYLEKSTALNADKNLSQQEKLTQNNDLDKTLVQKMDVEIQQLKQLSDSEDPVVKAKIELLEKHKTFVQSNRANREKEIQQLNALNVAQENANKQAQELENKINSIQQLTETSYSKALQVTENSIESVNLLTQVANELAVQQQQLEQLKKGNPSNQKIDAQLNDVVRKIGEISISLEKGKTELAQQQQNNQQQSEKSTAELIQEIRALYFGSLQSDFNSKPTTKSEIDQVSSNLTAYATALNNRRNQPNIAPQEKQIIDEELAKIETRQLALKTVADEMKATELAQQQQNNQQQSEKSTAELIQEIQALYAGSLQSDFNSKPTTKTEIDQVSSNLTAYSSVLNSRKNQPNTATQEKQIIDEELSKIETRQLTLKTVADEITATELAQQQNNQQQSEKSTAELTQEIQALYVGSLQSDFNSKPTTKSEIDQVSSNLTAYSSALNNRRNQPNIAPQEKQIIDEELAKIETRQLALKTVANEITANELAQQQQNNQQQSEKQTRTAEISTLLAKEDLSKTERKQLQSELVSIKEQEATRNNLQKTAENQQTEKTIASLQEQLPQNDGSKQQYETQLNRLNQAVEKENNSIKKELLLDEITVINTQYQSDLERKIRLNENQTVVEQNSETRIYSENQLLGMRRKGVIEIDELILLKKEKNEQLTNTSKKDKTNIQQEIAMLSEREAIVRKELKFVDEQLALYKTVEQPLPLTENKATLTYNEERQIAASERYDHYAKAIAIQNELINEYNKLSNELIVQQTTLDALRQSEIGSENQKNQKQTVLENIQKISLSLVELEAKISDADNNSKTHLPTDSDEMMKFQNLVTRGVNPIKKMAIATALIPISANGIDFNPAPPIPELKTIPVDVSSPRGLVYRVQIGAFARPIPESHFREFTPVSGEKIENSNITRYMAGYFNNAVSVVDARDKIKQFGYNDAFIVAYCDGKRISFGEARRMEERNECVGLRTNELQIEVASNFAEKLGLEDTTKTLKPVSEYSYNQSPGAAPATAIEQFDSNLLFFTVQVGVYNRPVEKEQLLNLQPLYTLRLENGQIRYSVGMYGDLSKAKQNEATIRNKGISDAFVTAYFQGKRISVDKARELLANGTAKLYSEEKIIVPTPSVVANTVKETVIFTSNNVVLLQEKSDEKYLQFVSKESFESYPREALNRFNAKGNFYFDGITKKIKSAFYPTSELLPRIGVFSDQIDTVYYSKSEVLKSNDSKVTFVVSESTMPGDLNDWLMKFAYRKSIVRSENGLNIHIFDVRLEDVQEMKVIAEILGYPLVETQNLKEYDKNDE